MNHIRTNSLSPLRMPQCRWSVFLDDVIEGVSILNPKPYPVSPEFLFKEECIAFKNTNLKAQASTWACSTQKIRQARAACIEAGQAASVLNLVMNPFSTFELPFFGADFVTLPSGHLLALDLQPALKNDTLHTQKVWSRLLPIHQRWKDLLPDGGNIPKEAEPFFSPGFLWARIPLGDEADEIISSTLRSAFKEYLQLYIQLVQEAKPVSEERSLKILSGQKAYINYRRNKDPARGMLSRFFGKNWTEQYIRKTLVDL